MDEEQTALLESLGLPTEFDGLDDDATLAIEDALFLEMQHHGINEEGDGLNDYGSLCIDAICALPDD